MKNRMKDDESLMLGLSQQAGYLVAPDGMKIDRAAMISKKWYAAGWLEEDRESMTAKGLTIKGGRLPTVEPVQPIADALLPSLMDAFNDVSRQVAGAEITET